MVADFEDLYFNLKNSKIFSGDLYPDRRRPKMVILRLLKNFCRQTCAKKISENCWKRIFYEWIVTNGKYLNKYFGGH